MNPNPPQNTRQVALETLPVGLIVSTGVFLIFTIYGLKPVLAAGFASIGVFLWIATIVVFEATKVTEAISG